MSETNKVVINEISKRAMTALMILSFSCALAILGVAYKQLRFLMVLSTLLLLLPMGLISGILLLADTL
jgi:hypothetical protein